MSVTTSPPAASVTPEVRQQVDLALRDRLPPLVTGVARKINVAQVLAASGTIGDIEIDKIVVGTVQIGKITLQNTNATLHSASAHLQNVRMVLELKFTFDWWYDFGIASDHGTDSLGSLSFAVPVGDVEVPSLHDIPLSIPSLTAVNASATVPPISNVDLAGGGFTGLQATNATIPADGFQLSGLGLGAVTISSLGVPRATVEKVAIQQFKPNGNLVLPALEVDQLTLPSASAADIHTQSSFGLDAIASRRGVSLNFSVFGGTIWVTPIVHMNIGAMQLQNVNIAATIGQISLQNISLPIDVRGINLKAIDIAQVDVNNITL